MLLHSKAQKIKIAFASKSQIQSDPIRAGWPEKFWTFFRVIWIRFRLVSLSIALYNSSPRSGWYRDLRVHFVILQQITRQRDTSIFWLAQSESLICWEWASTSTENARSSASMYCTTGRGWIEPGNYPSFVSRSALSSSSALKENESRSEDDVD